MFVYGEMVTPNRTYDVMEELSREKTERKYASMIKPPSLPIQFKHRYESNAVETLDQEGRVFEKDL